MQAITQTNPGVKVLLSFGTESVGIICWSENCLLPQEENQEFHQGLQFNRLHQESVVDVQ
ncbi:unnamed protein product [Paramecium primaurelia]|uniref:Uncharacterized protein n=1 Tax=Paramecium primaurelia TaxID=5886 RepID=A0A8S1K4T2_PARPR|nr:unnamed protein product [Paramecium primaurelia]